MLHELIEIKKQQWLQSPECTISGVLDYINKTGKLREPQVAAIATYLFLKIQGNNRPLSELFADGFFISTERINNLDNIEMTASARDFLRDNKSALALYEFAESNDMKSLLQEIKKDPGSIDYESVINNIFYGISYPDYLMSLPMGAGKTYLMAAIIFLDIYFSMNEADNPHFARNFLILIPNALKSSIGPSLKTIEDFDPEWVLPKEVASKIKSNLRFEVLDEGRKPDKSMKTNNPNASKVEEATRSGFNNIFIVNAEKIILNKLKDHSQSLSGIKDEKIDEDANELRYHLGQIPNLGVFIDEVHHATSKEIKLRQVVNNWRAANKNISYVLGFSGTPYLRNADKLQINDSLTCKIHHIANTVYYYPLHEGVKKFLKLPEIKYVKGMTRKEIIKEGVSDFIDKFGNKKYNNGAIAKLVIYCPSIKVLEEDVYPLLVNELKISQDEVLKYHKGNKNYRLSKDHELFFRSLDLPNSPHRYVLLVGVGREGWDCRSLTSVILAQEGDCKPNMVLQTSCRCLREVDGGDEEALIWLNDKNAEHLNNQLEQEQNSNIKELNSAQRDLNNSIQAISRMEYLELPKINYYRMKIEYTDIVTQKEANTDKRLLKLSKKIPNPPYTRRPSITTGAIQKIKENVVTEAVEEIIGEPTVFNQWILQLSKESFGLISIKELCKYEKKLKKIFNHITIPVKEENFVRWNNLSDLETINHAIRLCFHCHRELKINNEFIDAQCDLLNNAVLPLLSKELSSLYPDSKETENILKYDKDRVLGDEIEDKLKEEYDSIIDALTDKGLPTAGIPPPKVVSFAERSKERSFHYAPYNFSSSKFEKNFLKEILKLRVLKDMDLEIYYNGARNTGGFVIECYTRKSEKDDWHRLGNYTADFLLIKREKKIKGKKEIKKIMIIETKGKVYSNDINFIKRQKFVDKEFVKQNNEVFGYKKFAFSVITDDEDIDDSIMKIHSEINNFFTENHAS